MKNKYWILLSITWIASLLLLIIALTDIFPENPFINYRLIIGIWFFTISGFMRIASNK
ncbi:MAG: hypothetical protein JW729_07655 [Bacteroidales bacterium]|nr:hypothetical protein [Bacteroidales bacterium]